MSFSWALRVQSQSLLTWAILLCFVFLTVDTVKPDAQVYVGEIWFTAWRALYTYIYYFKLISLRNFQISHSFPLIFLFFTTLPPTRLAWGTNLENLFVIRQYGTSVKSRTLELKNLNPPLLAAWPQGKLLGFFVLQL